MADGDHLPPVGLAGAARDAPLRLSAALSREEVLRRRRRRLAQLFSLYRAHYWALADELPARHARYWWHHGASPELPDDPPYPLHPQPPLPLPNGGGFLCPPPHDAPPPAAGGRAACAAPKCEAKAMPLSPYCFPHILLDPKQQLYKPCAFVTKKRVVNCNLCGFAIPSGSKKGEATCGKPVLRGSTPLRCADHDPKSQKLVIEALKNAGIDLPLTIKNVPKLSLLISQTVREIQMKRKLFLNGAKSAPCGQSLK
ncbi:hypothetical protein ACP4OV_003472 [Aristida adscensionis]